MIKYFVVVLMLGTILLLAGCSDSRVDHFESGGSLLCVDKNLFAEDGYRTINIQNGWEYQAAPYRGCSVFKRETGVLSSETFCVDECEIE